jgi:glycosyltransferase involved in cell wall biosynthesis
MSQRDAPHPILLMYLGRRGISQIVLDIAGGFARSPEFDLHLALSRQNENVADFSVLGNAVVELDTFERGLGALGIARFSALKRQLRTLIATQKIRTVLNLMPHVWTPGLIGAVKAEGARYLTVVHDAQPHPGDWTGVVHARLMQDAYRADGIFTLSRHVTEKLVAGGRIDPSRITTLFLPTTGGIRSHFPPAPEAGQSWRFLFIGRLMAYKGLPLFVEAIEKLVQAGHPVSISVMGEGDISDMATRLDRLGATRVNRWLTTEEIAAAYSDHHAVVLSHIEASQSGIAASATGAGIPVIALPVGGVAEQVEGDLTGIMATAVTADALAAAMIRFMTEPGLYARLLGHAASQRSGPSVDRFVAEIGKKLLDSKHEPVSVPP